MAPYLLLAFTFLNLYLFLLMGWDKHCARKGHRRVPEKRLITLAALGAWPGMWLGQRFWRHKTKKASFNTTMWGVFALEIAAAGYILWKMI